MHSYPTHGRVRATPVMTLRAVSVGGHHPSGAARCPGRLDVPVSGPVRLRGGSVLGGRLRAGLTAIGQVFREVSVKRGFDLGVSAALILISAPLLVLVAAVLVLDSRGPILFRQTRVGVHGRPFTMYKFRSMYVDAEARLAGIRALSDRQGICFKSRHDPRVTRVGRLLRRYSIDELPQIFNVVMGSMSLVGPRPALPAEVADYPAHARERLTVQPGITGLWQVSGRADIGFAKMVDMDLAYVRSQSLALDLLLLAMTLRAVISGRGAY